MSMNMTDLKRRAKVFADQNGFVIGEELGSGLHGIVLAVEKQPKGGRSAIKIHAREDGYVRERDAYLRLQQHQVTVVRGCNVPELIGHDDRLWIIEMTIVTRPFVLDFAGAYLDRAPDFFDEVLHDWRAQKQEQFESDWPEVQAILGALGGYGIFVEDVNPGNISLVQ